MELIKKLFPMAFTLKADLATMIVDVIIHFFVGFGMIVVGDLMLSLGVFGTVIYVISRIAVVYVILSAILSVLHYFRVIK